MGTATHNEPEKVEFLFRYLQGYMGTTFGLGFDDVERDLDTFKDIWGRQTLIPQNHLLRFRYLQGYMGTVIRDAIKFVVDEFRYLQGYMGTISWWESIY